MEEAAQRADEEMRQKKEEELRQAKLAQEEMERSMQ